MKTVTVWLIKSLGLANLEMCRQCIHNYILKQKLGVYNCGLTSHSDWSYLFGINK